MAKAHHDDEELGALMGRAVAKGAIVSLPIAYIGVVIMLLLTTSEDLGVTLATAFLPGVLLAGFFGGFYGMVKNSG